MTMQFPPIVAPYVYDATWFDDIRRALANSHNRHRIQFVAVQGWTGRWLCNREYIPDGQREWHHREQMSSDFHPAVTAALHLSPVKNMVQLVMEWPHRSDDGKRLAYTPDERKGEKDIQTVTTVGRYLTRHFPLLDQAVIARLTDQYNAVGCEIHRDTAKMIDAVTNGPTSCMQWDEDEADEKGGHPYEVYAPELGWGICIRLEGGDIMGRALVLDDGKHKCFVRSYKKNRNGGYSHTDDEMNGYLTGLGYERLSGWPEGTRLKYIERKKRRHYDAAGFLAPYIDGDVQNVDSDGEYLYIREDGEFDCTNTDGTCSETERYHCEDCNEAHRNTEDMTYVGYHSDRMVCSCCSDNYTYVFGRHRNQYYVPDDDAVEADGESYDRNYLSDNDIVELSDGDYSSMDNATACALTDEWYLTEDCEYAEDLRGYVHRDNAWQCYATDKWYSTEEESVDIDGETYHPDDAPDEESDDPADIPLTA